MAAGLRFVARVGLVFFNIIYLGAFATAVGFVTYYLAVKNMGVGRTAATLGLVPFLGVIGAAVFLGERLTPLHAIGGALVVMGIALSGTKRGALRARDRKPGPTDAA